MTDTASTFLDTPVVVAAAARQEPKRRHRAGATRRALHKRGRLTLRKTISATLTLLTIGALWFFFAPTSLGGYDSYVITNGTSMLPAFHTGDLVILRERPSYHLGEVAGYHDKMLGVVVMHQIVGMDGKRFIFKGENNSFDDPYEPAASQIVGAEWIHIPRIGFVLKYFHDPFVAAAAFALLWLFAFADEKDKAKPDPDPELSPSA